MTALERLLKARFLRSYLDAACNAHERPIAVAVWAEGRLLASGGDCGPAAPSPGAVDAVILPLRADGAHAGDLVVRPAPCPSGARAAGVETVQGQAGLLAASLQAIIDAQQGKRAVAAEALDLYRELSQLHRAAVGLYRSLRQTEVADALLDELGEGNAPADVGAVFRHDPQTGAFAPLSVFRGLAAVDLTGVTTGRLFREIVRAGRGEIVNGLAGDPRWDGGSPDLTSVLVVPFMDREQCSGALLLGTVQGRREFTAGDLKRASTLSSMAAAALRNAQLFEEVLEIKNYSETVFENLSNGVITLDCDQRVTRANAAALQMLRLGDAEVMGRPVLQIFTGENAWVANSLGALVEGAEHQKAVLDRELRRAGAQSLSINLSVLPLRNVANEVIGSMLVLEDVTREKRIRGTMARFVSDRVVEKLLDEADAVLGGTAQRATIMFSDIRDFTSIAEAVEPRELVSTLNDYFTEMVDVVFDHGGTLDKFIGDSLMAVFGAPFVAADDADRALKAAVGMIRRLRASNHEWKQQGRASLGVGIGVNTGEVVAGTIGSPKRMDYTVIGDHVNLAARIEVATKYYGVQILVSEHTIEALSGKWRWRELDRVRVKGRAQPIRLFEVLDHHTDESFPEMEDALAAFTYGLAHYRGRDWQRGAACFAEALRANPADRPTQIFLGRCWTHLARPPDDSWSDVTDLGALAS